MTTATINTIANIREFILDRRSTFPVTQFIPQIYDNGVIVVPDPLPDEDANTIYDAPNGDDIGLLNAIVAHADWPTVSTDKWIGIMAFDIGLAANNVLAYKLLNTIKSWCEAHLIYPAYLPFEELANRTIVYINTLNSSKEINVGDPAYVDMIKSLALAPTNIEQTEFVITQSEKTAMLLLSVQPHKRPLTMIELTQALGRGY